MNHYGPDFVKKAQELRKVSSLDYTAVEKLAQDLVGSAVQFRIGEAFHKAAAQVKMADSAMTKHGGLPSNLKRIGLDYLKGEKRFGPRATDALFLGRENNLAPHEVKRLSHWLSGRAAAGDMAQQKKWLSKWPSLPPRNNKTLEELFERRKALGIKLKRTPAEMPALREAIFAGLPAPGPGMQLLNNVQRVVGALTKLVDTELVKAKRVEKQLRAEGVWKSKTADAKKKWHYTDEPARKIKGPIELDPPKKKKTAEITPALVRQRGKEWERQGRVIRNVGYPASLAMLGASFIPKINKMPWLRRTLRGGAAAGGLAGFVGGEGGIRSGKGYQRAADVAEGGKFPEAHEQVAMSPAAFREALAGLYAAKNKSVGKEKFAKTKKAGIWEILTGQRESKLTPVRTGKVDPAWKPYPASAAGLPQPSAPTAQPKVQQAGMLPTPKINSGNLRSMATADVGSRMRRAGL